MQHCHLLGVDEDTVPEQRVPHRPLEYEPALLVHPACTWVEGEDLKLEPVQSERLKA